MKRETLLFFLSIFFGHALPKKTFSPPLFLTFLRPLFFLLPPKKLKHLNNILNCFVYIYLGVVSKHSKTYLTAAEKSFIVFSTQMES